MKIQIFITQCLQLCCCCVCHQEAKLFMLDLEPIKKKKIIMAKGFDSVRNVCFSFFKCLHLIENKAIYTF